MAVGIENLPEFLAIKGVRIGVANAGIKQKVRPDVTLFELAEGATAAAVFTTNAFCAAPVQIAKKHIAATAPRYLLINTGNANAGTGSAGFAAAEASVAALAEKTASQDEQILPFSTGVIGELLPADKLIAAFDDALANLSEEHWSLAATSIMTTDTRPKGVSMALTIGGKTLNISGISKGAGMIKPNMATMLAYVAIDAKASAQTLQGLIDEACQLSFNSITVDGDTSTNDSAVLIASGQSDLDLDALSAEDFAVVKQEINAVFIRLAQLIIKDAEGATKFVTLEVVAGASLEECRKVAFAVGESPLVKTALFASDANWGRILAAVGRAGVEALDVSKISLHINGVLIAENGGRAASYREEAGAKVMRDENIVIRIDLGRGEQSATVWTCDFSHDYVTINADYRS